MQIARPRKRRRNTTQKRSRCRWTAKENARKKEGLPVFRYIDYKDVDMLRKCMTAQGKLFGRKRSGASARYQRLLAQAVKRARFMGLLPYIGE